MTTKLQGIFPALLTPFTSDNKIDEGALRRAVERNIEQGVSGFYVCGSTGEAFLLTAEERKRILEIVADQTKERVSIIAHIGAIATDLTLDLGRHAVSVKGVTALSSIPPFYYGFTRNEIIKYYLDIAEELTFPLIPYNFPKLSGVTLTPEIVAELRKNKNIVGIKFTSQNFYDLERIKTSDTGLTVFNGFDEMFLAGLSMGADGAIGSTFNFMADKFIAIKKEFAANNIAKARELQTEANTVIQILLTADDFMAAEKYAMDIIGISYGVPRRPFMPLTADEKKFFDEKLPPLLNK